MSFFPVNGMITCKTTHENDKADVEWEIPNFFSSDLFGRRSDSPPFLFINTKWCLRMDTDDAKNSLYPGDFFGSLYLVMQNSSSRYSVTFTLDIRRLSKTVVFGPETRLFDKNNTIHGKKWLLRRWDINHYRTNTGDNSLVVYLNAVATQSETACPTTSLYRSTTMCRNFQDLLLSGRRSDVTILVHGQKFKAHKVILEARSPVFAAMFEHDFTEKKENIIKLEDCDPDTFQIFLKCVYAGRVEDLTLDKAIRLYMISHKYTVTDIMENCVQLMKEYLSEETFCDILALANRYNETELKNLVEEYIAQNTNKIFSTNNWSSFVAAGENSALQKYS